MFRSTTETKSELDFRTGTELGMCADLMPNRLVEKQIAIATTIPTINNMILFANIRCASISNRH